LEAREITLPAGGTCKCEEPGFFASPGRSWRVLRGAWRGPGGRAGEVSGRSLQVSQSGGAMVDRRGEVQTQLAR